MNYTIYIYIYCRYKIADGSYAHQTISICDYKTIFTTNDNFDFIKGVYDYKIDDKLDMYNWEYGK